MSKAERRRFEASEQLQRLFDRQDGICHTCGHIHTSPVTMERAHLVANTKANVAEYGKAAIGDDDNMRAVCRGGMYQGRSCNDSCNLGGRPESARRLMERINRRLLGAVVEV